MAWHSLPTFCLKYLQWNKLLYLLLSRYISMLCLGVSSLLIYFCVLDCSGVMTLFVRFFHYFVADQCFSEDIKSQSFVFLRNCMVLVLQRSAIVFRKQMDNETAFCTASVLPRQGFQDKSTQKIPLLTRGLDRVAKPKDFFFLLRTLWKEFAPGQFLFLVCIFFNILPAFFFAVISFAVLDIFIGNTEQFLKRQIIISTRR